MSRGAGGYVCAKANTAPLACSRIQSIQQGPVPFQVFPTQSFQAPSEPSGWKVLLEDFFLNLVWLQVWLLADVNHASCLCLCPSPAAARSPREQRLPERCLVISCPCPGSVRMRNVGFVRLQPKQTIFSFSFLSNLESALSAEIRRAISADIPS